MAEIKINKDGEIEIRTEPYDKPCDACNGTGKVRHCPRCRGLGIVSEPIENGLKRVRCPNGCPQRISIL